MAEEDMDLFTGNPAVYTLPPGMDGARAIAETLLGRISEKTLPKGFVLLPNERSAGALIRALLAANGGKPFAMPRIMPVQGLTGADHRADLALAGIGPLPPPPMPGLQRRFLLTRLVGAMGIHESNSLHALRLADELMDFLDRVQTEELNLENLGDLVPGDYSGHWQKSLKLLMILKDAWPDILSEHGMSDPAVHRREMLARTADWISRSEEGWFLAAGSTGSVPAVARLIRTITRHPRGAAVLPGLDREMSDSAWDAIGPTHPQNMLKKLLAVLEVERTDVHPWPGPHPDAAISARTGLLSRAMAPAQEVARWHEMKPPAREAFAGLQRIDCANTREEAEFIALRLALARRDGKSASLITPDRTLARKVQAALRRYGLEADDSGGQPLALSPPAVFLRHLADAVRDDFAPVALLALLKHPFMTAGRAREEALHLARKLERESLRGPRPGPGLKGIAETLGRKDKALLAFLRDLETATAKLCKAMAPDREIPFCDIFMHHLQTAETLCRTPDGDCPLWSGAAGSALRELQAEMEAARGANLTCRGQDYPALFDTLAADRMLRLPRRGTGAITIHGTVEARMQWSDLVILGGLNEGTWPPEAEGDAWLSRPMRRDFGMSSPERRIGQSAHDFAEALGRPEVILTRARRAGGAPTVPGRWLLRLEALGLAPGEGEIPALAWVRRLDRPDAARPVAPPAPRPPARMRPRTLSVTGAGKLMRNPYALYAEKILGLRPLDGLDETPGARARGTLIHAALEDVGKALIKNAGLTYEEAEQIGQQAFRPIRSRPAVHAFWWPRFQAVLHAVLQNVQARAPDWTLWKLEERFRTAAGKQQPVTLIAKMDRIDRAADGRLEIIDYKTGTAPNNTEVAIGREPQLPLSALILARDPQTAQPPGRIGMAYGKIWEGRQPFRLYRLPLDTEEEVQKAEAGLAHLIEAFITGDAPFIAVAPPDADRPGDYDHLARSKEWRDEPREGSS